jgi:predicted lipoprotein with Yx(FWY)xxD motif
MTTPHEVKTASPVQPTSGRAFKGRGDEGLVLSAKTTERRSKERETTPARGWKRPPQPRPRGDSAAKDSAQNDAPPRRADPTTPIYSPEVSMKHWIKLLSALTVTATFAAIGAALAFAHGTTSHGASVKIANSRLGRILVDGKGITLYDFVKDKGGASSCYGACAALWPPLITKGKPHAGPGVRVSLLGTTKRKDGKLEVTYNHHPLYYFVTDRKPGQTTGQAVNQFGGPWWVLSPAGKEIHRG